MSATQPQLDLRRSFGARLRAIRLPLDQIIVIGGGVLAMHGIRMAGDIDLIVSSQLFGEMQKDTSWQPGKQGSSSQALVKGDVEAWPDWSLDGSGHPDYNDLIELSESIDGVRAVRLDYLVIRKRERALPKDMEDIKSIEQYLQEQN